MIALDLGGPGLIHCLDLTEFQQAGKPLGRNAVNVGVWPLVDYPKLLPADAAVGTLHAEVVDPPHDPLRRFLVPFGQAVEHRSGPTLQCIVPTDRDQNHFNLQTSAKQFRRTCLASLASLSPSSSLSLPRVDWSLAPSRSCRITCSHGSSCGY